MRALLDKALEHAESAEVFVSEDAVTPVEFVNGSLKAVTEKDVYGLALRLVAQGRLGMAASTAWERGGLVERALQSARYGQPCRFSFPDRSPLPEVKTYDEKTSSLQVEDLIARGEDILRRIRALDPDINCTLGIERRVRKISVANSAGQEASYSRTNYAVGMWSLSPQGFIEVPFWREEGAEFSVTDEDIEEFVRKHRLSQRRTSVPTGRYPVIFTAGAAWALLLRFFAGISGESVAKGTSPLLGKVDERIVDERITLVDDPLRPLGLRSLVVDDEGVPAQRTVLIDRGHLKGFLFDLRTATETGAEPTGNGFRRNLFSEGVEVEPTPQPSNFVLEPGDVSLRDMIKDIKRGIIVESVMGGHTGNLVAGEFSLHIGTGFLVEKGEVTGKVMDAMVAGNVYEVFNRIEALGDTLEPTLAIFYGFGYAPAIYFKDLPVASRG